MSRKIYTIMSLLLIAAFTLSACGAKATEAPAQPAATEAPAQPAATEAAATEAPADKVTVTWWHITTDEGQAAVWQSLADSYMAEHPNVIVEITILENEAFKTKMTTVIQSGEPPDIFQSWGGGVMKDITADPDADGGAWRDTFSPGALGVYSLEGKNYGVPWDMGMVGFWYNKDLFAQAGIGAPPTTWDELLEDVTALKAAGITPIALGEGDKWPGHFWFGYLATRICGQAGFEPAALRTGSFTAPALLKQAIRSWSSMLLSLSRMVTSVQSMAISQLLWAMVRQPWNLWVSGLLARKPATARMARDLAIN